MATEKKEIYEYDHLLDGGKTVSVNGKEHKVYEYDHLLDGGKTVIVDGKEHKVYQYDHLVDGGKTVVVDGEEHRIYAYDHMLDGGKTVYDNGERHDFYSANHLFDGGRTVYHTTYGTDSADKNNHFYKTESEIRKYAKMAPPHTRLEPDFDPSYKVITLSTIWLLAIGLFAMVNLRNYMAGPLGFLFLGLCFLPLTDRGPYTPYESFVPVFHIFLGLGILSLLPAMGPDFAKLNIMLGIIILFSLDILLSICSGLGKYFWAFGIGIVGLYFWHWGRVQAAACILLAFMAVFAVGTIITFNYGGFKTNTKRPKPDRKVVQKNLLAGFIPPIAAVAASLIFKKCAAFVYMAAVVAVAVYFIPKRKYSLYYASFLSVGSSFLFGCAYLSLLPTITDSTLVALEPVWRMIFNNPLSALLNNGIIEMIDGFWMIFDRPLTLLYHLIADWGSGDSYTGVRVFATGFLYLFMLFTGLVVTGKKNRKKR